MWKVHLSRWLNQKCGGNKNEMLSSRAHRTGWWLEAVIDRIFFWQKRHCKQSYRWEKKMKKKHNDFEHDFNVHVCSQCGKTYCKEDGVTFKRYTVRGEATLHYCSEACANAYYLNNLRRRGL